MTDLIELNEYLKDQIRTLEMLMCLNKDIGDLIYKVNIGEDKNER